MRWSGFDIALIDPAAFTSFALMYRFSLLLLLFLSQSGGNTQDLSGIWRGKIVMGRGGCFPVYQIELQLTVRDGLVTGNAYHFSDSSNYIRDEIVGTWDPVKRTASIRETGIVTFRINEDCVPCLKNYELVMQTGSGNRVREIQLRGNWSTATGRAIDGWTPCSPGSIVLNRMEQSSFPVNAAAAKSPGPKIDQLVQEIRLDSGLVQLSLYDNGEIDGDTVSVYVNRRAVIQHQMLKNNPIIFEIKIDPSLAVQDVVMVGENLGQIPPNTALMIVTTRSNRYQLYLTADDRKNALVRFIYDPKAPQ